MKYKNAIIQTHLTGLLYGFFCFRKALLLSRMWMEAQKDDLVRGRTSMDWKDRSTAV